MPVSAADVEAAPARGASARCWSSLHPRPRTARPRSTWRPPPW